MYPYDTRINYLFMLPITTTVVLALSLPPSPSQVHTTHNSITSPHSTWTTRTVSPSSSSSHHRTRRSSHRHPLLCRPKNFTHSDRNGEGEAHHTSAQRQGRCWKEHRSIAA